MGGCRDHLGRRQRQVLSRSGDLGRHVSFRSMPSGQAPVHGGIQGHDQMASRTVLCRSTELPKRWPGLFVRAQAGGPQSPHSSQPAIESEFDGADIETSTSRTRQRGNKISFASSPVKQPKTAGNTGIRLEPAPRAVFAELPRSRTSKESSRVPGQWAITSHSILRPPISASKSGLVPRSRKESYVIQNLLSQILAAPTGWRFARQRYP